MAKNKIQFEVGDSLVTPNEGKCIITGINNTSSGEFIEFKELTSNLTSHRSASLLSEEITKKDFRQFHHPIIFGTSREIYWFSVGYLAKHGKIELRTTPSTKKSIPKQYAEITGCEVDEKYVIYNPNKDTYTDNASVLFGEPSDALYDLLNFPANLKGKTMIDISKESCKLYNKSFIWTLFSFGFRTGTDHDITEIREYLDYQPDKYKAAFNKGYLI